MEDLYPELVLHPTWRDRLAARHAAWTPGPPPELPLPPVVPAPGNAGRGHDLCSGAAQDLAAGPAWVWHGFCWLDDLAAAGGGRARALARSAVLLWIATSGRGAGPGWTVPLAARRLARLTDHAGWLTAAVRPDPDDPSRAGLRRALAVHLRFLALRFDAPRPPLLSLELGARLLALGGGLTVPGRLANAAEDLVEAHTRNVIDAEGGLATRAPSDLAAMLGLLARAAETAGQTGQQPRPHLSAALFRAADCLRGLRHADGGLPRAHGGDAGPGAGLDRGLAGTGALRRARSRQADRPVTTRRPMGFVRLVLGRTSLVLDAAAPPLAFAARAHAGSLAFELTHGATPLVVAAGPADPRSAPEQRALFRQAEGHAALTLAGQSSAVFGSALPGLGPITAGPDSIEVTEADDAHTAHVTAAHNGFVGRFGLLHGRRLDLCDAGRRLIGEDRLTALTEHERRRLAEVLDRRPQGRGLPYEIGFPLHPDVQAEADPDTASVTLWPGRGGPAWCFVCQDAATMRLDPTVYLENTRAEPRAAVRIVLAGDVGKSGLRLGWQLYEVSS